MTEQDTTQVLSQIRQDCELGVGYFLVDRDNELRIAANPIVRQPPLPVEKLACVKEAVRQRLGRELAVSAPVAAKSLIFEFPDGVRSHRGKIAGAAPRILSRPPVDYVEMIRDCGAVNVRQGQQITHRQLVRADSTANDREVVACLKRTLDRDFNVYVGAPEGFGASAGFDDSAFRDFWSAPENENKAN